MDNYTEHEKIILSYFFTNIDSNIYCATDNMPSSLWALLLGGYSRSNKSLRNRLLQVFSDVANENKVEYSEYIEKIAKAITKGDVDLSNEIAKADKFMHKWSIEYGHNSLKDSSNNLIAIEQVSIRASKILEDTKLSAFQEKSTRYMDFSGDSLYLTGISDIDSLGRECMQVYSEAKDELIEYYKKTIDKSEFKTENAWIRTCNAKAFDDARYLLPTSVTTSLGATMNTRETERWISKLLSLDNYEVRELALKIKAECEKVTPALIKHVKANKFLNRWSGTALSHKLRLPKFDGEEYISSTLEEVPLQEHGPGVILNIMSDVEIEVAYSLINAVGYYDLSLINKELTLSEIFELGLGERGDHDEFPPECAVGNFSFDIICDIGAFRDIQRHRVGTQVVEKWSSLRGYSLPDVLSDESLSELKQKYVNMFEKVSNKNREIGIYDPFSEYCLLLGHNVRMTYTCDFKQIAYLIELRSGESGHYSYRRIAQEMYKLIESKLPNLSKHIRVNLKDYTDRRKQEENIQAKIAKNLNQD